MKTYRKQTFYSFISLMLCLSISPVSFGQDVLINEFLASNSSVIADEDGDYEDWIELYNNTTSSIDLSGYGLSDDNSKPYKWVFPSVEIPANGYILVWASGKDKVGQNQELHANFKISASGEPLSLTDKEGTLVDFIDEITLPTDVSYGRGINATQDIFFFFYEPTPNAENTSTPFDYLLSKPNFSHLSGFFETSFHLSLTSENPDATIIYTLDGSEPRPEHIGGTTYQYKNQYAQLPSQETGELFEESYQTIQYQQPIEIVDRNNDENKLANISSTWHFNPSHYLPTEKINKATVVRARELVNNTLGPTATQTFFVSSVNELASELPILNISLTESDLYSYEDGIYVAGVDFDNWRLANSNSEANGNSRANYIRRGSDYEKNANFQWFESGNLMLNQDIGVRIHGGWSRSFPLKTFRLYARNAYDDSNSLNHNFFGETNNSSFRRLILRNAGQDGASIFGRSTFIRDAFMQKLVSHLNFETQDYQPAIQYVNGEYFGLINLRERYDRHYFERKIGLEEGELDFLERSGFGTTDIKEGNNLHWKDFIEFVEEEDISIEDNYKHVLTQMDETNFIDYQIANIYFNNVDWPHNNIAFYRKKTSQLEEDVAYGHDGRWRWVLYDTDFGFGLRSWRQYDYNTLEHATSIDDSYIPTWSTLLLRRLLNNKKFKEKFINRFADLMNTTFIPERSNDLINNISSVIASEIPNHTKRWNTLNNWNSQVEVLKEFGEMRPEYVRTHLKDFFNLEEEHQVKLQVSNPEHGFIKINSISIEEQTVGVNESPYPWKGFYFENIPIHMEAIPITGYKFSHWSGSSNSSEKKINITLNESISLTAHFVRNETTPSPLYAWSFDNSIPNNTPLENIEASFAHTGNTNDANIKYKSSLQGYPFTSNHPSWRDASMERRNNPTSLNYSPSANYNISFENFNMRGLQVKQPFRNDDRENEMIFEINTTGFEDIKASFAVVDEGAVEGITIAYLNENEEWTSNFLTKSEFTLESQYKLIQLDFSDIALANNTSTFKFKINFIGNHMQANDGNRVTFNNIIISGKSFLSTDPAEIKNSIALYPNPFSTEINLSGNLSFTDFEIYGLQGNLLKTGKLMNNKINTEDLAEGMYILILKDEHTSDRFKIVKQSH